MNINHNQTQPRPQNDSFSQQNSQKSTTCLNGNGNVRKFMTTMVANTTKINPRISNGTLVDDGAPYNAMGMTDIRHLQHKDA